MPGKDSNGRRERINTSQDEGPGTYLLGRDHDADLLDGLGEFVGLDEAGVVQVEVLERLLEDSLLGGDARGLLLQLILQFSLETIQKSDGLRWGRGERRAQVVTPAVDAGRVGKVAHLPCFEAFHLVKICHLSEFFGVGTFILINLT